MEKKNLKWYESPEMEIIETELEGALLNASNSDDIDPDNDEEIDV